MAPALPNSDSEDGADENRPRKGNMRGWGPTGPCPVPWRPAIDLRKQLLELKAEQNQLRANPDELQQLRKKLSTAHTNEATARSRQELAELRTAQAEAAKVEALTTATMMEKSFAATVSSHESVARQARLDAEIALAKAAKREIEAAAAMRKADKHVTVLKSHHAAISQELMFTVKIAQSELAATELAEASAHCARAHLAEALAVSEQDRLQADAAAQGAKAKLKAKDTEVKQAKGTVERLQSQLVVAHVEAGRASEAAESQKLLTKKLKQLLAAQRAQAQEEVRHVLDLKAQMAKRARDAVRRASTADELQVQLDIARIKLRQTRKELVSTKAQLSLEAECCSSDDDSVSDDDKGTSNYGVSDDETAAAQAALMRVRAMPTWRAIRGAGNGKGAAKLEWGTRVIIYSLLAMMVPASAIGPAIVAIVKRTAPWLQPTAPSYEIVQRCRFELRLVEEALAARRIADGPSVFGRSDLTRLRS